MDRSYLLDKVFMPEKMVFGCFTYFSRGTTYILGTHQLCHCSQLSSKPVSTN